MNCDKILENIEYKCINDNEEIAKIVIQETLKQIEKNIIFLEGDYYIQKLSKLKHRYIYSSEYLKDFFEILEKYNYNPKHEIIGAISKLGTLKDPKQNSELINNLINSPYIDDISFNGNGFEVFSPQYGKTEFTLATCRYKHNKDMINYIKNNPLPARCHNHTLFVRAVFPSYYAVTALCKAPFKGKYYHSFSYDSKNDVIVDLCSNAVMDKDEYGAIFNPDIVSIILNSNISQELKITKRKTSQPQERQALLKIALYKQLLTFEKRKNDPNHPKVLTLK